MAKSNQTLVELLSKQLRSRRIVTNVARNQAVEIVSQRRSVRKDGSCAVTLKLENGAKIRVTYQLA